MVFTMSANLASLPLLHEHKVPHRSACLDGLLSACEPCESFHNHAPQKSAYARLPHKSP